MNYRVFKRSSTNWKEFARPRKITVRRDVTLEEAKKMCEEFNNIRTAAQIRAGTKMEFESQ